MTRPLSVIATEINAHMLAALLKKAGHVPAWVQYARPYVSAMRELPSVESRYGLESGYEVVLRCLCNLQSWRGEAARRVKAELKAILESCPADKHL